MDAAAQGAGIAIGTAVAAVVVIGGAFYFLKEFAIAGGKAAGDAAGKALPAAAVLAAAAATAAALPDRKRGHVRGTMMAEENVVPNKPTTSETIPVILQVAESNSTHQGNFSDIPVYSALAAPGDNIFKSLKGSQGELPVLTLNYNPPEAQAWVPGTHAPNFSHLHQPGVIQHVTYEPAGQSMKPSLKGLLGSLALMGQGQRQQPQIAHLTLGHSRKGRVAKKARKARKTRKQRAQKA